MIGSLDSALARWESIPAIGVIPIPAEAKTTGLAGVVQHDVPVREGQRQDVAHVHRVVQERRHLTGRFAVAAVDSLDRELAVRPVVGPRQAVLAWLEDAVRHPHPHRDVLAGQ